MANVTSSSFKPLRISSPRALPRLVTAKASSSSSSSKTTSPPRGNEAPTSGHASLKSSASLGTSKLAQSVASGLAGLSLGIAATLGAPAPSMATELDILAQQPANNKYVYDDANVLSRANVAGVVRELTQLQIDTGYHIDVVTLRKLVFTADPFEFADKVIEKWYPTVQEGDKHGVLLLVSTGKEGAIVGGPSFMKKVGDPIIEGIISENIPVLTQEEKFNEAISSSVKRIEAALKGEADTGGPSAVSKKRQRTYKTKEEASEKKDISVIVVSLLLFISFVVPMVQFFGYTAR